MDGALPDAGFDIVNRLEQPGAGAVFMVGKGGSSFVVAVGPGDAGSVAVSISRN